MEDIEFKYDPDIESQLLEQRKLRFYVFSIPYSIFTLLLLWSLIRNGEELYMYVITAFMASFLPIGCRNFHKLIYTVENKTIEEKTNYIIYIKKEMKLRYFNGVNFIDFNLKDKYDLKYKYIVSGNAIFTLHHVSNTNTLNPSNSIVFTSDINNAEYLISDVLDFKDVWGSDLGS